MILVKILICAVDLNRGSAIDDHDDVEGVHVGVLSFFLYRYSKGRPVCSVTIVAGLHGQS